MSFDRFDASVLRAMLRLARRRQSAHADDLSDRVGAPAGEVRASLRRLRGQGFVEIRYDAAPRLTLSGFTVAVALLPPATARRRSRSARPRSAPRTSRAA